jgi:ribosomal protein L37AE/L43A
VATALSALSISVTLGAFLTRSSDTSIPFVSEFRPENLLIFWLATIAGAIACVVLAPRLDMKKQRHLPVGASRLVPSRAGREYPYQVLNLSYEDVKWSVYAQDRRPMSGEPLVVMGPKCPKCSQSLEESEKSSEFRWKCVQCKFKITKKENMEKVSERVQELAASRLKEETSPSKGPTG